MKKILITGASGFLGWNLCITGPSEYQIEGLYYRQNFENTEVNWHRINLLAEKELRNLIKSLNPAAVIHAAAIANPNFCEEHPALAHHINVYATMTIAETCKALNIPMIFCSTDLVFNGSSGNYSEADFAFPLSIYGEQKLAAEEVLADEFDNMLSCRLPLMFGFGPSYSNNFFKDCLQKLKSDEEILAFSDEYRSPLSAKWAASGLWSALNYMLNPEIKNKEKLLHLGGPEKISRYEFALLMADVFAYDNANISALLRAAMPMPAARPEDVSLDSSLAAQILDFKPPTLREQLLELKMSKL